MRYQKVAIISLVIVAIIFVAVSIGVSMQLKSVAVDSTPKPPAAPKQTNDVRVTSVHPDMQIVSPVMVSGDATQNWYADDGSFTIEIHDASGALVGQAIAHQIFASSTLEYVPFSASVTFRKPSKGLNGTVVLRRGVASDAPTNDVYVIPVQF